MRENEADYQTSGDAGTDVSTDAATNDAGTPGDEATDAGRRDSGDED